MDPTSEKAVIAVQSVIVIVALVGNSLVCAIIMKNPGKRYVKPYDAYRIKLNFTLSLIYANESRRTSLTLPTSRCHSFALRLVFCNTSSAYARNANYANTACLLVGVDLCFHIRRTTMNCLLLNLAFADITVVAFFASRFILIRLYNHPDGEVGTILCKLLTGGTFGWIGSCASVFTLVAIAIERYYAVIRPLGNRATFTKDSLKVRFLASETTNHNLYLRT